MESWRLQSLDSDRKFYKSINEIRIQMGLPPVNHPSLEAENQENDRSIFIKIHFEVYSISCEVLDRVFFGFGVVERIEKLSPPNGFHSKICFQNKESTLRAFDALNGRNIYEGCCQLELFLVKELSMESSISHSTEAESSTMGCSDELVNQDSNLSEDTNGRLNSQVKSSEVHMNDPQKQHSDHQFVENSVKETREPDMVIFASQNSELQLVDEELAFPSPKMDFQWVGDDENRLELVPRIPGNVPKNLSFDAYKLFDLMPRKDRPYMLQENSAFDECTSSLNKQIISHCHVWRYDVLPHRDEMEDYENSNELNLVFDPGGTQVIVLLDAFGSSIKFIASVVSELQMRGSKMEKQIISIFDLGTLMVRNNDRGSLELACVAQFMSKNRVIGGIWIFDPGGELVANGLLMELEVLNYFELAMQEIISNRLLWNSREYKFDYNCFAWAARVVFDPDGIGVLGEKGERISHILGH